MASTTPPSLLLTVIVLCWALVVGTASVPTTLEAFKHKHHFPKSYAAIGDSYAAGVGAGAPRSYYDFRCGRYTDAYPIMVANSSHLNISEADFKNLACGGLTSALILRDQVPYIGDSDLVSLTASGNDVDFWLVLNECVYHWTPRVGCEAQLVTARNIIESVVLVNLDRIIAGATARLKPGALLVVTGYARFFNDRTSLCDNVTFSQTRPLDYLTKAKRTELNQLVAMLNDVIKATAQLYNAVYLDIDAAFEGHRFCEEGVHEPDLSRSDTWFFNIPPPNLGKLRSDEMVVLQAPLGLLPPWEEMRRTPEEQFVPEWPEMKKWRVFHPTSLGHQGISERVIGEVLRLSKPRP